MSGFLGLLLCSGAAGGPTPSEYIAFGSSQSNARLTVYPWNNSTGFGTAYGRPTAAQGLLSGVTQTSFVPDNSNIAVSFLVSPYFSIWRWSSLGFGTRYSDPSSLMSPSGTGAGGFTWTSAVDAFLTVNNFAPFSVQGWAWNSSSGFGTKYANGPALNLTAAYAITMNSDSSMLAIQFFDSPYVYLYPWSSSTGLGTKFADPATLPGGSSTTALGLSFNKVTNDLAEGYRGAPTLAVYPTSSAGFGTKYANPPGLFTSSVNGLRFVPNGSALGISVATPIVYQWGAGFGTKYASPVGGAGSSNTMDWESTSQAIASGNRSYSPQYVSVYRWSSGGFGAIYSQPTFVATSVETLSFSNQSR